MRTFWISLLAVVSGYVAMVIVIMGAFSLAYLIMGANWSYQPGSWNVSTAWVIVSILIGFGTACLGGRICTWISRNHTAPKYLIAVILAMGMFYAMMAAPPDAETVRMIEPSLLEAMDGENTVQPRWFLWLNPLLGSVGVALGSGLLTPGHHRAQ